MLPGKGVIGDVPVFGATILGDGGRKMTVISENALVKGDREVITYHRTRPVEERRGLARKKIYFETT